MCRTPRRKSALRLELKTHAVWTSLLGWSAGSDSRPLAVKGFRWSLYRRLDRHQRRPGCQCDLPFSHYTSHTTDHENWMSMWPTVQPLYFTYHRSWELDVNVTYRSAIILHIPQIMRTGCQCDLPFSHYTSHATDHENLRLDHLLTATLFQRARHSKTTSKRTSKSGKILRAFLRHYYRKCHKFLNLFLSWQSTHLKQVVAKPSIRHSLHQSLLIHFAFC